MGSKLDDELFMACFIVFFLTVWLFGARTRQYRGPHSSTGRREPRTVKKGNDWALWPSKTHFNMMCHYWEDSITMNQRTRCCFVSQSEAHSGRRSLLANVIWKGDEKCSGSQLLQAVPADRVQRGEHDVLARLRGPQKGDQQECGGGESPSNLRGLHLDPFPERGEPPRPGVHVATSIMLKLSVNRSTVN